MRGVANAARRAALLLAPVLALTLAAAACTAAPVKNPKVEMVVEGRGSIEIELFSKDAPKTVSHFLSLVKKHFYDGILFHRVKPGFVAQAGDPASRGVEGASIANLDPDNSGLGSGGSGTTVPLEARAPHDRGTLGLARSSEPNSGDSQFFFNLVPNHRLDSGYTVFGKIVHGMDVMDSIKQGDRIKTIKIVESKK